jgi:hypothetical protein
MTLYKNKDGKRIKMTVKEKKAMEAEWAILSSKQEELLRKRSEQRDLRQSVIAKLLALGLTQEEIEALFN